MIPPCETIVVHVGWFFGNIASDHRKFTRIIWVTGICQETKAIILVVAIFVAELETRRRSGKGGNRSRINVFCLYVMPRI
jgi:hypothetical protein